jgi:hypothetical protein
MYAQFDTLPDSNTEKKDSKTEFSSFSIPINLSIEVHSNFNFKTRLSKDFSWELQGNYDTQRLAEIS